MTGSKGSRALARYHACFLQASNPLPRFFFASRTEWTRPSSLTLCHSRAASAAPRGCTAAALQPRNISRPGANVRLPCSLRHGLLASAAAMQSPPQPSSFRRSYAASAAAIHFWPLPGGCVTAASHQCSLHRSHATSAAPARLRGSGAAASSLRRIMELLPQPCRLNRSHVSCAAAMQPPLQPLGCTASALQPCSLPHRSVQFWPADSSSCPRVDVTVLSCDNNANLILMCPFRVRLAICGAWLALAAQQQAAHEDEKQHPSAAQRQPGARH